MKGEIIMDRYLLAEAEKNNTSFFRKIFINYIWLAQIYRKHMEVFSLFL